MRPFALIACLLLTGCPGRLRPTAPAGDAGEGADAGGEIDAGFYPLDAGAIDAGPTTCELAGWHLEVRPVETATPLFPVPSRIGVSEQFDLAIHRNSTCERVAYVEDVGYSGNATDFIAFKARVWAPTTCADSGSASAGHFVHLVNYWGNMRVVVADRSSDNGEHLLEYGREECGTTGDCSCLWNGGPRGTGTLGSTCHTDCACSAGLSCLCAIGVATAEPCVCAKACADFLDCQPGEKCGGVAGLSCGAGNNCPSGVCPDGFQCGSSGCVDQRGPISRACGCDTNCGGGEFCLGENQSGHCVIPCARDNDCPNGQGLHCTEARCQ